MLASSAGLAVMFLLRGDGVRECFESAPDLYSSHCWSVELCDGYNNVCGALVQPVP